MKTFIFLLFILAALPPNGEGVPPSSQIHGEDKNKGMIQQLEDAIAPIDLRWVGATVATSVVALFSLLLRHRLQSNDRRKGLTGLCNLRIREAQRRIRLLSHSDECLELHGSCITDLTDVVTDRMKWMKDRESEKANKIWRAFVDFDASGCRDAGGDNAADLMAKFTNQKAESTKESLLRLLESLRKALK